MMKRLEASLKEQKGSVLALYAVLFLAFLVPLVGLAVEYGRFLVIKSQLQSAAEAAAISGAETIAVQNEVAKININDPYLAASLDVDNKDYTVSVMSVMANGMGWQQAAFDQETNEVPWNFFVEQLATENSRLHENSVPDKHPDPLLKRVAYRHEYGIDLTLDEGARLVESRVEDICMENLLRLDHKPSNGEKEAFAERIKNDDSMDIQRFYGYYRYSAGGKEKKADYYGVYMAKRMQVAVIKYIGVGDFDIKVAAVAKVVEKN